MPTTPHATAPVRGLRDVVAGCTTAVAFYAEYVSLGSGLGEKLVGAGAAHAAVGGMLVLGAVLACCVGALFRQGALLAGPRAASLLVLGLGLEWAQTHAAPGLAVHTQWLVVLCMLWVAAAVQWVGATGWLSRWIQGLPPAVGKGFMFATAFSIMAGLVQSRVAGCLQYDFAATALVYGSSVALAVAWLRCKRLASVKVLALLVGLGVAWAGCAWLLPGATSANHCGTVGGVGLQWQAVWARVPSASTIGPAWASLALWQWAWVVVLGVLLGLVQLIESLTTLEATPQLTEKSALWPGYVRCSAAVNALGAPLGLACSAYSSSRSSTARDAGGTSRLVPLVHGLALLAITLLATRWVAQVPVLAIAVALTLVAVSMIDATLADGVWHPAHQPQATPPQVHAGWLFWLLLATTMLAGTDYAIAGLLVAGLAAWAVGHKRTEVAKPRSV